MCLGFLVRVVQDVRIFDRRRAEHDRDRSPDLGGWRIELRINGVRLPGFRLRSNRVREERDRNRNQDLNDEIPNH